MMRDQVNRNTVPVLLKTRGDRCGWIELSEPDEMFADRRRSNCSQHARRLRSTWPRSHLEAFAQIKLAADGIVDKKILCAFALDASIVNQIRAIHDGKRLADIVIGDHDGQS
jgi:hypothetical protein